MTSPYGLSLTRRPLEHRSQPQRTLTTSPWPERRRSSGIPIFGTHTVNRIVVQDTGNLGHICPTFLACALAWHADSRPLLP